MVILTPSLRGRVLGSWPNVRYWLDRVLRQPAVWYAGFAVYAACVALFSGPGLDHWWGTWAACGYAVAAAIAARWPGRNGQLAAVGGAVAGALVAPLTWLATAEPSTPDVAVVARSGVLLLHHGTPYLPAAQLAHGGWLAYDPYLPVMALFGLPKGLGLPGILGDPRPWLVAATFALLYATLRIVVGRASAGRATPAGPGHPGPGHPGPGRLRRPRRVRHRVAGHGLPARHGHHRPADHRADLPVPGAAHPRFRSSLAAGGGPRDRLRDEVHRLAGAGGHRRHDRRQGRRPRRRQVRRDHAGHRRRPSGRARPGRAVQSRRRSSRTRSRIRSA